MEWVFWYGTELERVDRTTQQEHIGHRMLHDDFLPDGTKRLTFTDEEPPSSPPSPFVTEWQNAQDVTAKLRILGQMLGLEE